ncbi:hypothetical protein ACE5JW_12330 [Acinetobacter radioresistens]|jgi:hypothetical protein|uniref:SCP2 domain-containing protein n=1 Tax=Acinetobacter radioresistens SK82 TaxID=596318 RepID=A0ABM9YPR7_ACIRA|nr:MULTISPECIES: hypothetical protein [Acinetobacter]EET83067.1 hypothetical protein ACIRA0001_3138 [Acinetobacter radioresistens SK82]EEY87382.1 hypothetical protein HMPREF0018_00129 [Acinetobacter radioresistens SH164]ENV87755.1 hypothetical protein F940_00220 [Acinetobacter radioresistens NIPH 2130]EXB84537.1 hypothetical protein J538_1904 [Acinetobacter sp. 272263]EXC31883.1 hypothetical protein J520_1981 [Acinetobacter sp. 869535]
MQFFDLSRQFNLNDILTPKKTLDDLGGQEWFLSKIRVEYDCLASDSNILEGQAILKSSENIQIELEWVIVDTGYELQILFKGIEDYRNEHVIVTVKGAQLVELSGELVTSQALALWIEGTLLIKLPHIRREIKSRLNLWDYIEYQD